MAKKFKNNNQTGTIDNGIYKLRAAANNPANMEMFKDIINGNVDSSVVDKRYMNIDVTFDGDELDHICRVLTRQKIQAFKGNMPDSIRTFGNQFLENLNIADIFSNTTQRIITIIAVEYDSTCTDYDENSDEWKAIVTMCAIKNALKDALGKNVYTVANDSIVVEKVDEIPTTTESKKETVEDVEFTVEEDDSTKVHTDANESENTTEKEKSREDAIKELHEFMTYIQSEGKLDIFEEAFRTFKDKNNNTKEDTNPHDIRKEKVSDVVNQKNSNSEKKNELVVVKPNIPDFTGMTDVEIFDYVKNNPIPDENTPEYKAMIKDIKSKTRRDIAFCSMAMDHCLEFALKENRKKFKKTSAAK